MNLADQIEALARAATNDVAAASQRFSTRQRDLEATMSEHRRHAVVSDRERLRADLEDAADAADATPMIMLPADIADATPHSPWHTT